uniref:PB1 domain-containing protein n=1 Tax=Rhizophora mucronata TaxID=61149 RepID=A0A2P2NA05_RHIMU
MGTTELMVKLGEFCGYSVELRCQLPGGDLETLISVKSDDELAFLIEEYERSCPGSKIRAILSPRKSINIRSPLSSTSSSVDFSRIASPFDAVDCRLCRSLSSSSGSPTGGYRNHAKLRYYPSRGQGSPRFLCHEPCCYRKYY